MKITRQLGSEESFLYGIKFRYSDRNIDRDAVGSCWKRDGLQLQPSSYEGGCLNFSTRFVKNVLFEQNKVKL